LSATGPEVLLDRPCTAAAAQRRPLAREGRLWLSLRTALVAVQVACVTLIGWIGATLTLLPLAMRGAPAGRRVWSGQARVVRLLGSPRSREAVPR
jgi:hypothetical protein